MSNNLKNMRTLLLMLLAMISLSVSAQTVTLTGNVKDQTGEPIIGASVLEKGTTNGTITDLDGNFTLKVSGKIPLVVSYIGMKAQEIDVKGKTKIDVTLRDDAQALEEVVVIGYGTVAKKDLTGPVASVSAKQIANIPVSSASEAIQGKMAGVSVTTTEGSPDAEVKIRVRGGGSLSQDNSPLYIVDGFPVSSISDIAPSDIETIDVLKDASSTSIYGSRGANGVIIVTTKSGKEGKIQVNLGASFGVRKIANQLDVLNPYEYVMYQYELDQTGNAYGSYNDLDIYKSMKGTNYQDEIFGRTGNQQQYNVGISGGSKTTKFNITYSRNEEKSIMVGSGFQKNNINAKINTDVNKWIKLDFNARLSYQKINGASVSQEGSASASTSLLNRALTYKPIPRLNETAGDDDEENQLNQYDPLERLNGTYREQRKFDQTYNVGLNWEPMKGLKFRSEYGYGWKYYNTDQVWEKSASQSNWDNYGKPQARLTQTNSKSWRNANTLTYENKKMFGMNQRLNAMIGHEISSSLEKKTIATSTGFASESTAKEVLAAFGNGVANPTSTYIGEEDRLLSFFGRLSYTVNDKYLFNFTMRADASSKFAKGNRWGYFPSGAFAWRISDESWMHSSQDWLSNLKLRVGVGTAGNDRIPPGTMFTTYSVAESTDKSIYFEDQPQIVLVHGNVLSNPKLKWETTLTRNIGIDFGFFNNRLSGSIDAYWNTTKNLLMKTTIPSQSGYSFQYKNFGQTSNKGIELSLEGIIVENKDFSLSANFNISYNKNKIDKLPIGDYWESTGWSNNATSTNEFLIKEGGSVGEVYGYVVDGFYTEKDFTWNPTTKAWDLNDGVVDSRTSGGSYSYFGPGALKLKKTSDDGTNKINENDKVRLGNTVPKFTGGFGVNARWKNFDLSAFFNYSIGNKIVNATKLGTSFYSGSKKDYNLNSNMSLANRYTIIDPVTGYNLVSGSNVNADRLAELNQNATMWSPASVSVAPFIDWAVEDGSFLRINNITLGYTLPKLFVNKLQIQSVRVYVTGYNLHCFTKYSGSDPEVDTRRSTPLTPGVDYSAYPKSRSFVGGINVTF